MSTFKSSTFEIFRSCVSVIYILNFRQLGVTKRTERIWLKPTFNLMQYSHASKNLFNQANYVFKQQLSFHPNRSSHGYFTSSFELMNILRNQPTYLALPAHTSQQVIKFLVKAWKGFFNALKAFKQDPIAFQARPRPPKYKRKSGFHLLYFTNNQVKLKDGFLHFPKDINLRIATRLQECKIYQARILPKGSAFLLEIIYDKSISVEFTAEPKNVLAIDLGVNNLICGVSNVTKPIFINGRALKSKNQWFNKEKARLRSIYDLQDRETGIKMDDLRNDRYKQVEDFLHKTSKKLIDHCVLHKIDSIVIGYNSGWKQDVNLGKITNQNFVYIPFARLVEKIEYKALDQGVRVFLTEESYTSKCSYLDNESLEHQTKYAGKRVKRCLFRTSNGLLINADCNAAANIGKKVFPVIFNPIYGTVSGCRESSGKIRVNGNMPSMISSKS